MFFEARIGGILLGVASGLSWNGLGGAATRAVGNRPGAASAQSEIRFLEYRLGVIASWPDSGRKRVLMDAVARRLNALRQL